MSLLDNWDYDVYDHTAMTTYNEGDDADETNEPAVPASVLRAADEEDTKMFRVDRVEYDPTQLRQFVVANNLCAMVQQSSKVVRVDLSNPATLQEVEISKKPEDSVFKIFLDPTGNHILVSMENGDNYYLQWKQKQPKQLTKLKGLISAVAWNKQESNENSTREFLVGTTLGAVIEVFIENGKEKYSKQIYSLEKFQITGLHIEQFPPTPTEQRKFLIMATTPNRIYQFVGGPNFEALFAGYENPSFQELPGDFDSSELHVFSKYQGLAKSFAWLTEPGIYHGNLVFGSQNSGRSVFVDNDLLPYLPTKSESPFPISMILTEWHFLVLYPDRFQAISRLNHEVVAEEVVPTSSGNSLLKLRRDPINGTCWLYSSDDVYEIIMDNEDRHVWKLYMEKMQFDLALQNCKDHRKRDKVLTAQADHYFSLKKMKMAATYYAKTRLPFEQIALKFVSCNERDALSEYLHEKLKTLRSSDVTQKTLLCTWLVEIYLDRINLFESSGKEPQKESVLEEFRHFLEENKEFLNKKTVFELISSHGRVEEMLTFARMIEDFERVINHFIQKRDYLSALNVMSRQYKEDIYYKFSPILMQYVPAETVTAWMTQHVKLVPSKLLPALMRYKHVKGQRNHAIYYLCYCIEKRNNRDPAIHNYLLSMYAQEDDEAELLKFLDRDELCYDRKYALRICREYKRNQACVKLYSSMHLFEEALDLALTINISLAKDIADMPGEDESLKKRLWLKIARHVVEKDRNIKKALDFLSDCPLIKIEDILPFFPDFVLIDDFKEEICRSLDEYNRDIAELQREMDESTSSAEQIRQDIKDLRNRYSFVGVNNKCELCQAPILSRQFYIFPCHHAFHVDCLTKQVVNHLGTVKRQRYFDTLSRIQRYESESSTRQPGVPQEDPLVVQAKTEQLRNDLDDIIGAECFLCGEIMIKLMDEPFVTPEESADMSWEIR